MECYEGRAGSSSGLLPVFGAILLGGLLGGGMGLQHGSLAVATEQLRGVIDSPALGGSGSRGVALDDIQAARAARSDYDLDADLAAPWPKGRIVVGAGAARSRPSQATFHYSSAARQPFFAGRSAALGLVGARLPQ